MRNFLTFLSIMFVSVLLASCSQSNMDGIILDISESQILLATEISSEEYEEIKDFRAKKFKKMMF